jgi:hypothetical protein
MLYKGASSSQVLSAEDIKAYEDQINQLKQGRDELIKQKEELKKQQRELYA